MIERLQDLWHFSLHHQSVFLMSYIFFTFKSEIEASISASNHFKMINVNYQRRQQQHHHSARMHICFKDVMPAFFILLFNLSSCWLACRTVQPAVRSEQRWQHASQPRDWSSSMLQPVRGSSEDRSVKKKKKNTLQHVPDKFERLWNSAGGRGQPIPPWQWWMASTGNGKRNSWQVLIYLQQDWPVALVHSWTDTDCAASTCVAAFIMASFDSVCVHTCLVCIKYLTFTWTQTSHEALVKIKVKGESWRCFARRLMCWC